jgi:hypothetical protein|nr:hypothetical protein [uncultured Steroidobacter sp.]
MSITISAEIVVARPVWKALQEDPLGAVTRQLQLTQAVVTCAERAATHDLVEVHCLADVLVAITPMIELTLHVLDQMEAAS